MRSGELSLAHGKFSLPFFPPVYQRGVRDRHHTSCSPLPFQNTRNADHRPSSAPHSTPQSRQTDRWIDEGGREGRAWHGSPRLSVRDVLVLVLVLGLKIVVYRPFYALGKAGMGIQREWMGRAREKLCRAHAPRSSSLMQGWGGVMIAGLVGPRGGWESDGEARARMKVKVRVFLFVFVFSFLGLGLGVSGLWLGLGFFCARGEVR